MNPENPVATVARYHGVYLGTNKLLMSGLFFSALFNAPSSPGGAGTERDPQLSDLYGYDA